MSVRTLGYWAVFLGLTIAGLFFGWPGETPTYRLPVTLPAASVRDEGLVPRWLSNPGGPMSPEEFQRRRFLSAWSFVVSRVSWIGADPGENQEQLVNLGFDGQKISWTAQSVLSFLPFEVRWLKPIAIKSAEVDPAGFLVVTTKPDWKHTFKTVFLGLILGVVIDMIVAFWLEEEPRRFFLQWPVRRELPKKEVPEPPLAPVTPPTAPPPKVGPSRKSQTSGRAKRTKK